MPIPAPAMRSDREEAALPLPARTREAFSIATAGCGFRCLNCQNWEISQAKPEETKDPRGEPLRLPPAELCSLTGDDAQRLTLLAGGRGGRGRVLPLPLDRLHLLRADRLVRVHDRHGRRGPGQEDQELLDHLRLDPGGPAAGIVPSDRRRQRQPQELQRGNLPRAEHGQAGADPADAQDAEAAGRVVRGHEPGGAHLHRQAGDDPADVRLAGGQPWPGLSAALLPLPPGAQAEAAAAHAGGDFAGGPRDRPLRRAALRLHRQLPRGVRRRDHLLPPVPQADRRAGALRRGGDADRPAASAGYAARRFPGCGRVRTRTGSPRSRTTLAGRSGWA